MEIVVDPPTNSNTSANKSTVDVEKVLLNAQTVNPNLNDQSASEVNSKSSEQRVSAIVPHAEEDYDLNEQLKQAEQKKIEFEQKVFKIKLNIALKASLLLNTFA